MIRVSRGRETLTPHPSPLAGSGPVRGLECARIQSGMYSVSSTCYAEAKEELHCRARDGCTNQP